MLGDSNGLGNALPESLFEPGFWSDRGELEVVTAGRGAAWFVGGSARWVLRHYRRGGFVAHLVSDRYAWRGEHAVRSFREWRLLAELTRLGLPVPQPVAARYRRTALWYRCDLITQRIADARPLSAVLSRAPLGDATWRRVGAVIARLHAAGADHADLNAHNILVAGEDGGGADGGGGADSGGRADGAAVSIIDFDRGRLRRPGGWTRGNLERLHRSLSKIARELPPDRFSGAAWDRLLAGYAAGSAACSVAGSVAG